MRLGGADKCPSDRFTRVDQLGGHFLLGDRMSKPRDRGTCGEWRGSGMCVDRKCPMASCSRWSRAQALRMNHLSPAELAAEDATVRPAIMVETVQ